MADIKAIVVLKGGPGSGHRGHVGRPGKRGGSLPGAGLSYAPSESTIAGAKKVAQGQLEDMAVMEVVRRLPKGPIPKSVKGEIGKETEVVKAKVAERLADDLARPIAIRRGIRGATDIVEGERFKTQFETGTSGGWFNTSGRADAENRGLGVPTDLPDQQRPVYGYYKTDFHSAGGYGSVEFVLKDSVKNRATYTVGDSLHNFDIGRAAGGRKATDTQAWDGNANAYYNEGIGRGAGRIGYIEAQIQGGLSLSDVAKVVIHADSHILRDYGSVIDVMNAKGIVWEVDAETE